VCCVSSAFRTTWLVGPIEASVEQFACGGNHLTDVPKRNMLCASFAAVAAA
jgi:hypothetical protein